MLVGRQMIERLRKVKVFSLKVSHDMAHAFPSVDQAARAQYIDPILQDIDRSLFEDRRLSSVASLDTPDGALHLLAGSDVVHGLWHFARHFQCRL